jgi:lipopolysaccharide transport system ATP-binding protein
VDRKYERIVEFSGVEKFIDTPVKRYSSGMAVRLAFSVAAHLEPEIMMIDEVLSVGDAAFQKKCVGKMEKVSGEGRTVLFVSHNMAAVTQLCERAIWLEDGRIKMLGPASDIVSMYLGDSGDSGQATWRKQADFDSDKEVQFESVRLLSAESQPVSMISFSTPFKVEIRYKVIKQIRDLSITIQVFNSQGVMVFESMNTDLPEWRGYTQKPGHYLAVCSGPENLLKPGRYTISVISFLMNVKVIERIERILSFDISDVGYYPDGRYGIVSPLLRWKIKRIHHTSVAQKDLSAI